MLRCREVALIARNSWYLAKVQCHNSLHSPSWPLVGVLLEAPWYSSLSRLHNSLDVGCAEDGCCNTQEVCDWGDGIGVLIIAIHMLNCWGQLLQLDQSSFLGFRTRWLDSCSCSSAVVLDKNLLKNASESLLYVAESIIYCWRLFALYNKEHLISAKRQTDQQHPDVHRYNAT